MAPRLRRPGSVLGPRANRTIAAILDATGRIFLARGYAGTTIDEITRVAGVSRGSFYTYFPSKRDVLLALGANSLSAAMQTIDLLADVRTDAKLGDLEKWVQGYLGLLEEHGAFAFAWTQAAHDDEEIRRVGMKAHLQLCRHVGLAVARLGDGPAGDPTEVGLLTVSMLEQAWSYAQLYGDTVDRDGLGRGIAHIIAAAARGR